MRVSRIAGVVVASALSALAGNALAHGKHIYGTVVSATEDELVITTVDPVTQADEVVTFAIDRRTRVKHRDGDSVPYAHAEPAPGDQVSVTINTSDLARRLATVVHVVASQGPDN